MPKSRRTFPLTPAATSNASANSVSFELEDGQWPPSPIDSFTDDAGAFHPEVWVHHDGEYRREE